MDANGNYITTTNSVNQNLSAIDSKIGTADSANGTYTRTNNTVNRNVKVLDTQVKRNADAIEANKALMDDTFARKADVDANNVGEYATQWGDAIGTGKVVDNDGKLVTGDTVYKALHDKNMTISVGSVTADEVKADSVDTENLKAEKADIANLKADIANIGNLEADAGDFTELHADKGTIDDLTAGKLTVTSVPLSL